MTKKYTEDQIVRLLRKHANKEGTIESICREAGVSTLRASISVSLVPRKQL